MRRLGLLGGTFDPVHYGHLDAAEAARRALELNEVWLLPAHVPSHRPNQPMASPFQRFALAALAVTYRPHFRVSDIDLLRTGLTYTIDTLRYLHTQGWNSTQLFFILGTDAFAEISTWHQFPTVLDAANFVVIARPGTTLDEAVARTPAVQSRVCEPSPLVGSVNTTRVIVLPAVTRDVSSTMIRQRLQAGESIDDLVPPAVARHIVSHHLYGAVDDLHGEGYGSRENAR